MTHNEMVDLLTQRFPGARWTLHGTRDNTTYADLEWLDASPKPTEAQLTA